MSFVRPELAARLRRWREPLVWGALLVFGAWLAWRGYAALAPLPFVAGLLAGAAGLGLLQAAVRRLRLSAETLDEGVVVIDEARIAYLGPHQAQEVARTGCDGVCIVRGLGDDPRATVPAFEAALQAGRRQPAFDAPQWPHPSLPGTSQVG